MISNSMSMKSTLDADQLRLVADALRARSSLAPLAQQWEFAGEFALLTEAARAFGIECLESEELQVEPTALEGFPLKLIHRHEVFPLERSEQWLRLAVSNPFDLNAFDSVASSLELEVRPVVTSGEVIRRLIKRHLGVGAETIDGLIALKKQQSGDVEMLEEIGDVSKVGEFIKKVKDKNAGVRLMGFGHRVYKNFDPRAKIIKVACDKVLEKMGIHDPLLDIAKKLEEHALNDDYFKSHLLYPNVDFYSGIIYKALRIPTDMFTVMFALGRLPGWIANWKEMIESPNTKIGRPRQIYTGPTVNDYVPMAKRS